MRLTNNLKIILLAGVAIGILTLTYYLGYERKKPMSLNLTPTQSASQASITTSSICPPTITDIDGNTYKTVQIGSQCWMKENLKVTKDPQDKPITRYCYNNDNKICDTDGGLYDWNTAMNNSTKESAQGICPNGWHVPKDSEWYTLEKGLTTGSCDANRNGSGCYLAGTKLKTGGSSGFEAILVGSSHPNSESFGGRGTYTIFWSSTENDTLVWTRFLQSSGSAQSSYSIRFIVNKIHELDTSKYILYFSNLRLGQL